MSYLKDLLPYFVIIWDHDTIIEEQKVVADALLFLWLIW